MPTASLYAVLLRRWAEVYRLDGQERKAGEIGAQGGCAVEAMTTQGGQTSFQAGLMVAAQVIGQLRVVR